MRWATAGRVRSLHWDGDELVDWVAGGTRWGLDGVQIDPPVHYAYVFDRAVVSPSGRYQALYTECGTKGLILDQGNVMREINRSFYHASDYEYPITLARLADGREVLVHCPDHYNRLEIDDLESGRRLTLRGGESPDVFHSRLSLSPDGHRLLSGGWVWHPITTAQVFDLTNVLNHPAELDKRDAALWRAINTEVVASCWLTEDLVLIAAALDEERLDEDDLEAFGPGELGVWSVSAANWRHRSRLDYRTGVLLPFGVNALSLYDHPKLISPTSGSILAQWPELTCGEREYPYYPRPAPPVAVDPSASRFAMANTNSITVIVF